MEVGLAGAGLMGHGLGRNLLKKGHGLRVVAHRRRDAIADLVTHGAREVATLKDLATAEIILLCLPGSPEVEAAVETLLPHLRTGQIIMDASTSDPASSTALAARLARIGVGFADVPMAGGPEQAMAGETGVLAGAEPEVFGRIEPLIACYATRIAHMGGPGRGHAAKLLSNYLVTGMISLIADCFAAARKADVDAAKLYDVMLAGSGNSGALRKMVGPALEGDFDGYRFAIANAAKDIRYYTRMADGIGALSGLAREVEAFLGAAKSAEDPTRNVSRLLQGNISKAG